LPNSVFDGALATRARVHSESMIRGSMAELARIQRGRGTEHKWRWWNRFTNRRDSTASASRCR
jgi:hypothetical protein